MILRIHRVCWQIDNFYYVMMAVRPHELAFMRNMNPDLIGIPSCYTIGDDGEPEWFPNSKTGWPVVTVE